MDFGIELPKLTRNRVLHFDVKIIRPLPLPLSFRRGGMVEEE